MKTNKFLFALLPFFLIFSSCSSDEDNEPGDNNLEVLSQLLGKWRYDGLTVNGGAFEESPDDDDEIYEFKTGGIFTITVTDDDDDDDEDNYDDFPGTYSLNNSLLTIRVKGETIGFTIIQISDTSLRLSTRLEADENPGLDDVIFYFTKILN